MEDGTILLREYVTHGDEQAFGELVNRYMDLVYSAALRQVGGNASLAQDVVQTVFADLARKAKYLFAEVRLGGWLYRRACFIAKTAMRTETRRKAREQAALAMNDLASSRADGCWQQIAPILDDALNRLSPSDRDALILRFFERQPLRAVGLTLGTSEDAARMRVERALEKLRLLLAKRGVTSTAAALALVLANQAITAAPVGIAAGVTGAALAGATLGVSGITTTLFHLMAMTKLKIGLAGLLVAAGVSTPLVVQYRHNARLGRDNLALRQQVTQLATIRDAAEQLSEIKSDPNDSEARRKLQLELLRLRGMIAAQRQEEMALKQKLEAAEGEADLAKFELDMASRGPSASSTHKLKATKLPEQFEIAKLQPAGREKAINAVQSVLYSVFHGGVDTYYDLEDDSGSTTPRPKSDQQDRIFKENLAQMRRMWGGDAAKGIKNLMMADPLKPLTDGSGEDRYQLSFMIDYGTESRPAGAATQGCITFHQTPDGWKVAGSGSSMAPFP
jgi:RNA polymerase sigma factor (sigma-70 family)